MMRPTDFREQVRCPTPSPKPTLPPTPIPTPPLPAGQQRLATETLTYGGNGSADAGLLASDCDQLGDCKSYDYENTRSLVRRMSFSAMGATYATLPRSMEYDLDGRLTKVAQVDTETHTYDADSRLTSTTYENGDTISYNYYSDG